MESQIRYKLHENQGVVWIDKSRFRVVVAGRRFGKTTLAIHELFQSALLNDKSVNWYISPTYKQSKMIAWKMLLEIIPPQFITKTNETELKIVLDNKSEICLKGADNEDSLRGVGLHFVVLDEVASMKDNVWQEIVRPMLADTKGRALFIGTPKGKNAFWELWIKGQKQEDGFTSWVFKTVDNPHIDPSEVLAARQQMSERYFKQEFEASFEDYVGLIYPEFKQKVHVIDSVDIPSFWEKIGGIDPAITGMTGCLSGAIDTQGNLYITDEYYETNKRACEVAIWLRNKGAVNWHIDTSSKSGSIRSSEGAIYSMYDEFIENGIVPILANKDVDAGINRTAEYFRANKIFITRNCKHLIWELERYHWAEEREGVLGISKPVPYKKDDHLCDCLRYMIMSRPLPSEQEKKVEIMSYQNRIHKRALEQMMNLQKIREQFGDADADIY